jgi:uncharacterized protein (DUF58 family)
MKTRLVLALTLGAALVLALAGGFTLLWRFFVFAAVVLLPSFIWPRLTIRKIDGRVAGTPALGQVGTAFEQDFQIVNRSKIPTPLVEVGEVTDLPGYENAAAFSLGPGGQHAWRTRVSCRRRGRYTLGVLDVKVADPLGLFPVSNQLGAPQEIMVYPATAELPHFQALPRLAPDLNRRRWLAGETGPGASRVREYTSGDSLRHIHWPTTAHAGELMVKEFDPDRSSYAFKNVWLVPDLCHGGELGDGEETAGEYVITIAASLAKKYLDGGKYVGMLAAGEAPFTFPPGSGEPQLERILWALALAKIGGECSLGKVLADGAERFEEGSAIIVIMPSHCPTVTAMLRRAVDRGAMVSAILLDSLSFGGEGGAGRVARSLRASDIRVYIVRRGERLAEALDSRQASWQRQYREVGG